MASELDRPLQIGAIIEAIECKVSRRHAQMAYRVRQMIRKTKMCKMCSEHWYGEFTKDDYRKYAIVEENTVLCFEGVLSRSVGWSNVSQLVYTHLENMPSHVGCLDGALRGWIFLKDLHTFALDICRGILVQGHSNAWGSVLKCQVKSILFV